MPNKQHKEEEMTMDVESLVNYLRTFVQKGDLKQIEADTGIHYQNLYKFKHRQTINPGATAIDILARYFVPGYKVVIPQDVDTNASAS